MDCKTARLLLEFARPAGADLEAADAEALTGHLADCPECGALARQEQRLDQHLGRAVRAVAVPEGLRGRLLTRLAVERDAWYRRLLWRATGIAAALALLLLVGGMFFWHHILRPEFDPDDVVYYEVRATASPDDVEAGLLEKYGVQAHAPSASDFHYQRLAYYGMEDNFAGTGKRVPVLVFAGSANEVEVRAQLYILTEEQFRGLRDKVDQPARGARGFKVKTLASRAHPGVYYVVVYPDGWGHLFFVNKPAPSA